MLAAHRKDLMLDRLREDGQLNAKGLAVELGVSEDSIRRDLRELAAAGLCQRVYGGALPISPAIATYAARQLVATGSKTAVSRRAVDLVTPRMTVILDGGTTTLAVARALPADLAATIVTHSPTVAAALVDHPTVGVYLLGGQLLKHSAVTCGAAAVEAARNVHADLFLLGVTGVHPDAGLTTGDPDEAAMKRALAHRAADTYVLASAEKIGTASPFAVIPLEDISGIVTDSPPKDRTIQQLRKRGVNMIHA